MQFHFCCVAYSHCHCLFSENLRLINTNSEIFIMYDQGAGSCFSHGNFNIYKDAAF